MRAITFLTFYFFIFNTFRAQDVLSVTEEVNKLINLCTICTCSEIRDVDGNDLVFNIQCEYSEDSFQSLSDLDKIEWPANRNGLKISAAFERLGLSTLSKLPPNSQVENLRFDNNAIKIYWPEPFSDLPNLKKLSLARNELTQVTPDLFTNINALEDLDLSYNKLSDFNPLDFATLVLVKRFNLQSNMLKTIPVEALLPMVALEDLDLSKNGIADLLLQRADGHLFGNIKRLNLSGNRIRSVTKDSFPVNNSIEYLDLSNNIIEMVEIDSFLTCGNLKELSIGQNNITFVFALPASLQIAKLEINTLYHWPDFPSGITFIDLSYNRLTDMYDENKVHFDNLEILYIGGNQIKEVNIEKRLPKLYSLDLSYNLISDIPKSLNSRVLPNLEKLQLDGNPIENIYFKEIIALKSLYMTDLKKLVVVDDKAFSNVIGRDSREWTDEETCFSLFLSHCDSLRDIRDDAFDATSLCMLDISNNNLTHLSRNLLDWRKLSDGVNLQFNPWHCSCELQWVLDELLPTMYKKNSNLLSELRCGSPRAYEGLRLVHWYNWTEQAMCSDLYLRSGPGGTYLLESTDGGPKVSYTTLILAASIIVSLLIAIALIVYLVKSRKRHNIRQAALKRKRQSAVDAKHTNGTEKEQFSALNKA